MVMSDEHLKVKLNRTTPASWERQTSASPGWEEADCDGAAFNLFDFQVNKEEQLLVLSSLTGEEVNGPCQESEPVFFSLKFLHFFSR